MNSVPPSGADSQDPPTDRTPTTPTLDDLSHLALRDDGRIMLSLEDCADRDLTGRTVLSFILLTPEETARALRRASDGLAYVAARTANELPPRGERS